jgi:hypothetical protein
MANLGCVIAFLGLFVAGGASGMVVELVRLVTWRAVPAVVVSSSVGAVRGSKGGTSYRPLVTYTYRVESTNYTSSTATVIAESRSWTWATGIAGRYRPGSPTTAYVDPRNPAKAYLVHEFSAFPLAFVIVPLVFAAIVSMSVSWQRRQLALAATVSVPVIPSSPAVQPRAA